MLSSIKERVGEKESVKFIDNNNCSKDEIERMEKTEEIFQSYADSVTMVK